MATYIRLTDYKSSDEKEQEFFNPENRYEAKQEDFSKISSSPIAYWVSSKLHNIFQENPLLTNISQPRVGFSTGDNDRFMKYWYEVFNNKIGFNCSNRIEAQNSLSKWFPHSKGGGFRKWYGNDEYVVNWENDGYEIRNFYDTKGKLRSRPQNLDFMFKEGITWGDVGTEMPSFRYQPACNTANARSPMLYVKDYSLLALLNTNIVINILETISPTITFNVGEIAKLPIILPKNSNVKKQIETLTQQNIDISKEEWDSRETSWDFTKNELIKHKSDSKIETAYTNYCNYWKEKFNTLHQNEEELNRLFIDIYELQDELTPDVSPEDITILKKETKIGIPNEDVGNENESKDVGNESDGDGIGNKPHQPSSQAPAWELIFQADEVMKQFISYGVGVMFGRYSLDKEGLWIANLNQDISMHSQAGAWEREGQPTFEIDDDNIIPVLEDDYFKDDIASRFVQFVKTVFGEEHLSENIRFIENSLGSTLRKYFVKGFYEDHIKRYKKRPIYWMVASPKKGFMSLIYMHRYEADTFARVRNSYLTEYIAKLEAHKETLALTTSSDTASDKDKKDADKQMKNIDTKLKEIIEFDRDKMMHFAQNQIEIDLDDGVKVNYCKFKDILYPITGLCK
ncbi:BREX-1 system adenine-specific DNA-methyltransferase PglX [Sulfurimonas sp. NW15]|uniref:BREX-1 system adenine-specific DNA-methyltransferase PglX n=1 Tax=Sulfurimonas sp. NW15 TaxID=2922729 RepID=UPI003DA800C6